MKFRWRGGVSNQSVCALVEWFQYYEGTRGLPGRERSAQLQAFDVCIIYGCGTYWDVGDSIFCRVRKWSSARLPDITPNTGIIAPQFGSALAPEQLLCTETRSRSLSLSTLIFSFCPELQQCQHSCPCGTVSRPSPLSLGRAPCVCMRRWNVSLWKALREGNKMERKYEAPSE